MLSNRFCLNFVLDVWYNIQNASYFPLIYIYKLFGYKFPLKYVHVILESPSMWCFFFVVFFAGLFLKPQDYLTLDLSHLSLAGQQRQHVWNVVETDTTPPRSLIPRSCDGSPLNCLWFVFFTTPLVFSKEWGWNFSKNSSECLILILPGSK